MGKSKILELCMDVRNNTSSEAGVSVAERKKDLVEVFSKLLSNYDANKTEINAIITENVDEVVKFKLQDVVSIFAEIGEVGLGVKKKYRVNSGKIKAHTVALATEIRRQKIYKNEFTAEPYAVGASVYTEWEDVLLGNADAFTQLIDKMAEAVIDRILADVQRAFVAAMDTAPTANKYKGVFNLAQLNKLANTVGAYGTPAIVGTAEALSNIISDPQFQSNWSDSMKDTYNNDGFIGVWAGKPLIQLPNTFTDENNLTWELDNNQLFVIPVDKNDKPVKVTKEGTPTMLEQQSFKDGSITKKIVQRVGVDVLQTYRLGMFTIE